MHRNGTGSFMHLKPRRRRRALPRAIPGRAAGRSPLCAAHPRSGRRDGGAAPPYCARTHWTICVACALLNCGCGVMAIPPV